MDSVQFLHPIIITPEVAPPPVMGACCIVQPAVVQFPICSFAISQPHHLQWTHNIRSIRTTLPAVLRLCLQEKKILWWRGPTSTQPFMQSAWSRGNLCRSHCSLSATSLARQRTSMTLIRHYASRYALPISPVRHWCYNLVYHVFILPVGDCQSLKWICIHSCELWPCSYHYLHVHVCVPEITTGTAL